MTEDPNKRLILAISKVRSTEPELSLCEAISMVLRSHSNARIASATDEELLTALESFLTKKYQMLKRSKKKNDR